MAELCKRLALDLPDPLAGDVEVATHLFERPLLAIAVEAVAEAEDLGLTQRQR